MNTIILNLLGHSYEVFLGYSGRPLKVFVQLDPSVPYGRMYAWDDLDVELQELIETELHQRHS